ncbi:MAG: cytochrome c [Duganella sp.]
MRKLPMRKPATRKLIHCVVRAAVAATAGVVLASAAASYAPAAQAAPAGRQPDAATPALIERGKYLATAGDCAACHTQAGRPAFTGGVAIASPLGTIYSTNITPSGKSGIGGYTLAQFSNAVRGGVRADGSHLYPAMPYTAYARLTDDDTAALYAYFMHGVPADDTRAPATALPFPFNLRFSMALWNALYLDPKPYVADQSKSVEWNRGAYLALGLAHCATCHTPRNFLMGEQSSLYLRGGSLGTWYAPDITMGAAGKPGWNQETLVAYLTTGHATSGAMTATAGGPMLEAIDKSFSRMDPQDIQAMTVYLTDLPGARKTVEHAVVPPVSGSDIAEMAGRIGAGEQLYRNNCASCHQAHGDGMRGLPALRNHAVLRQPTADNVSMAILDGVWPEHRQGMPGFRHELSDAEIADLTNYVMTTFGESKVSIDAPRVAVLRQGGAPSPLLWLARGGMAAGVLVVLALLWRWRRRRPR